MSLSDGEEHRINKAMEHEDRWEERKDIMLPTPERLWHTHLSPLYLCVWKERQNVREKVQKISDKIFDVKKNELTLTYVICPMFYIFTDKLVIF